jgi:hypothetical protein
MLRASITSALARVRWPRSAEFQSTPAKRNPAPVRKREPGHFKGSFQKLSVPRDDRPLAEGSLTNRSLANGSSHRRRLSARQIGCDGSAHHRDRRKGSKEKLQHRTLPVLDTAATITGRVFGEYALSHRRHVVTPFFKNLLRSCHCGVGDSPPGFLAVNSTSNE